MENMTTYRVLDDSILSTEFSQAYCAILLELGVNIALINVPLVPTNIVELS